MSSWSPEISEHESYVLLTRRIQTVIFSPKSQIDHQAIITREPGDTDQNWDRLVSEISDAEGVSVTKRPNGSLLVTWFVTPDQ